MPAPALIAMVGRTLPASGGWTTRDAWTADNEEVWTGYTLRQVIDSSLLVAGSKVKLRLTNGQFYDAAIRAYIGIGAAAGNEYAFDGAPTDVTIGSSTSITIGHDDLGYTSVDTDEITLAVPAGRNLVVAAQFTGEGRFGAISSRSGWRAYYKAGSDAATQAATDYGTNASDGAMVSRIEIFSP